MVDARLVDRLRTAIGTVFAFDGDAVRLRDVLEDESLVVLELTESRSVQPTAYGDAHRRVPAVREISLSNGDAVEALLAALENRPDPPRK